MYTTLIIIRKIIKYDINAKSRMGGHVSNNYEQICKIFVRYANGAGSKWTIFILMIRDDSRHVVDFLDRIRSYIAILLAILEIIREQREEYVGENPTRTIAGRERCIKEKKGGIERDLGKCR